MSSNGIPLKCFHPDCEADRGKFEKNEGGIEAAILPYPAHGADGARGRRGWFRFRVQGQTPEIDLARLPDAEATPAESAEALDERMAVRALLRDLSPKVRDVLVLRYIEDCTVPEIARVLRVPEGTVKSRLNYALQQAARRWSKEDVHESRNR